MIQEPIVVQPALAAERFALRPLRRSDAGLIAMYTADRRLAEGTRTIPHPLPPGATEAFIARSLAEKRSEDVWVLDGSERGHAEVLGLVCLTRMERDQSEIKYWVAPAFWNTGYASEAVAALVAANPHRSRTLFAEVFQDNPGFGPRLDQYRLRLSRRCRSLFGRPRRHRADLDLPAKDGVTHAAP